MLDKMYVCRAIISDIRPSSPLDVITKYNFSVKSTCIYCKAENIFAKFYYDISQGLPSVLIRMWPRSKMFCFSETLALMSIEMLLNTDNELAAIK